MATTFPQWQRFYTLVNGLYARIDQLSEEERRVRTELEDLEQAGTKMMHDLDKITRVKAETQSQLKTETKQEKVVTVAIKATPKKRTRRSSIKQRHNDVIKDDDGVDELASATHKIKQHRLAIQKTPYRPKRSAATVDYSEDAVYAIAELTHGELNRELDRRGLRTLLSSCNRSC
ncbi:hypothetical protein LTR10_012278 [Elasticomyces elasticus]|nr:hypothetical protein LTR10_012278 [Elasticomyces elasticus]KAK4965755.1 hypothetical protein LTR42_011768 [Elasticomyces elasticus]